MREKANQIWGNFSIKRKLLISMLGITFFCCMIIGCISYAISYELVSDYSDKFVCNTMSQVANELNGKAKYMNDIVYDISLSGDLQANIKKLKQKNVSDYERLEKIRSIREFLMVQLCKSPEINGVYIYPYQEDCVYASQLNAAKPLNLSKYSQKKGYSFWTYNDEELIVGKAIYDISNMNYLGNIIVTINKSYFSDAFSKLSFTQDDNYLIVDERNKLVYCEKNVDEDLFCKIESGNKENVSTFAYGGKTYQSCTFDIQLLSWTVSNVIQDSFKQNALFRLKMITGLVFAGIFIFVISTISIISKQISYPLVRLSESMENLTKGKFKTNLSVGVKYKDEIGILRDSYNRMVVEMEGLLRECETEKILKQEAKIHELQMQMIPHFLYNTLDTINWLANDIGAKEISEVTRAMGILFRFSLGKEMWISLEEELDAIEQYMIIQKYRYGENLSVNVEIAEEQLYEEIPRHLILPLVENSIEHGFCETRKKLTIAVKIQQKEDEMIIRVEDDGAGMTEGELKSLYQWMNKSQSADIRKQEHMGIALKNINARLKLYYGEESGVSIFSQKYQGSVIVLSIKNKQRELKVLERNLFD